jgi:hypothetical protein
MAAAVGGVGVVEASEAEVMNGNVVKTWRCVDV